MPAKPAAATIEGDVRKRVNQTLIGLVRFLDEDSFEFKSLLRDAEKLANASAVSSSVLKAEIYQLTGNLEQAMYWLGNCRKLGATESADETAVIVLSNLGHFSQAAEYFSKIVALPRAVVHQLPLGILLASFQSVLAGADLIGALKLEVDVSSTLELAKAARRVMTRLNVEEASLRVVLDVAGEVLRRHRIMWAQEQPVIRTYEDEEDAGLLYELLVPVSAEEAFELTEEVTLALAERDIFVPGVAFSFLPAEG